MKKETKKEYNWSPYQQAIFDYIEHEHGHLVVEAAAGSGKSTTLVKCLDLIPKDSNVLLTAFNTDIVNELKKKTKGRQNLDTRTLHGLGLMFIRRNLPQVSPVPETFKYESYIRNHIQMLTSCRLSKFRNGLFYRYLNNIKRYVDFGRYYLCQTVRDLDMIEDRYGIDTLGDEKEVAIKVMEWGKTELEVIDYTDMIWLPNVLYLKPLGLLYDFIFLDECQDLNKAERELVLKCFKMGTRMMSVGDGNQCIYSFSGSDPESFNILKSMPNTKCLPLSISYRCGKNIVRYANKIVKSIEFAENAVEGEIVKDVQLEDVQDGDMVLCRTNAPLLHIYSKYLKMGRKAVIRGKDIGNNLKAVVKSVKQKELNTDCKKDGLFVRLYDDLFTTRNRIMQRSSISSETAMESPQIQDKLDTISALEVLSEGIRTSDELVAKIDEIFPKKGGKDGISLSTIHKAKGLEANNVYIACDSMMSSGTSKKDWEVRQEYNLKYVAYTRAKNRLGFIDEKDFEQFDTTSQYSIMALRNIESKVNKVLGKKPVGEMDEVTAKLIVETATEIPSGPTSDFGMYQNAPVKRKTNVLLRKLKKSNDNN